MSSTPKGRAVLVQRVSQGSIADRIGFQPGDAILQIGARQIRFRKTTSSRHLAKFDPARTPSCSCSGVRLRTTSRSVLIASASLQGPDFPCVPPAWDDERRAVGLRCFVESPGHAAAFAREAWRCTCDRNDPQSPTRDHSQPAAVCHHRLRSTEAAQTCAGGNTHDTAATTGRSAPAGERQSAGQSRRLKPHSRPKPHRPNLVPPVPNHRCRLSPPSWRRPHRHDFRVSVPRRRKDQGRQLFAGKTAAASTSRPTSRSTNPAKPSARLGRHHQSAFWQTPRRRNARRAYQPARRPKSPKKVREAGGSGQIDFALDGGNRRW